MLHQEIDKCPRCGEYKAEAVCRYGQYSIECPCGIRQGHRFFSRGIAIKEWNRYCINYKKDLLYKKAMNILKAESHRQEKIFTKRSIKSDTLPDDTKMTVNEAGAFLRMNRNPIRNAIKCGELKIVEGQTKNIVWRGDLIKWKEKYDKIKSNFYSITTIAKMYGLPRLKVKEAIDSGELPYLSRNRTSCLVDKEDVQQWANNKGLSILRLLE